MASVALSPAFVILVMVLGFFVGCAGADARNTNDGSSFVQSHLGEHGHVIEAKPHKQDHHNYTHGQARGLGNVGGTADPSALLIKHVAGQSPIQTIQNHARCTSAQFPDLELYAHPTRGDRCIRRGNENWNHKCPVGCYALVPEAEPYCLNDGTRLKCDGDGHNNNATTMCPAPFTLFENKNNDPNHGDICRPAWWSYWNNDGFNYVAPRGCYAVMSGTNIVEPHTRSCTNGDAQPCTQGGTLCRVSEAPHFPEGRWTLIASSTHGAEFSTEVGITTMTGGSVTTEMSRTLGTEVSGGASFPGAGALTATVSQEVSFSIAATVEHSVEDSTVRTITITCPDATPGDPSDTTAAHRMWHNPESIALEYLYQWEVSNGLMRAKTEHFRCHQSEDGTEHRPQCTPLMCGNPWRNGLCKAHPHDGADPRCQR